MPYSGFRVLKNKISREFAKAVKFPHEVRPLDDMVIQSYVLPAAVAVEDNLCSAISRHSASKMDLCV